MRKWWHDYGMFYVPICTVFALGMLVVYLVNGW